MRLTPVSCGAWHPYLLTDSYVVLCLQAGLSTAPLQPLGKPFPSMQVHLRREELQGQSCGCNTNL